MRIHGRHLFLIKHILVLNAIVIGITSGSGFLKVNGKYIVDGNGNEIILRGMGLGGWMLPEGYMLKTESFANAPWEIKKKISDLVGEQNADTFWTMYRRNFVQRVDIERLKALGFNSVRLAMHYEFYVRLTPSGYEWITAGFAMTDSLLKWCSDNQLYLILDLHAAPGGQSANNISDYNPSLLSLWESEKNKTVTVELWRKLAGHYAGEAWIGGYDILNEPAWDLPPTNKPLRDLSVAITQAIRSVDTNHIIFVEGNWFATDFNGMAPAWDDNMVWSFHKYWNSNDIGSINYLLSLRNNTNRPLWLGESGENSNAWFTDCISLLESNKIGWAWWTLKKFSTITGPYTIPVTPEYDALLRYWKGQLAQPTVAVAMKALMGMADGLAYGRCQYNTGVVDALLRQPFDITTKPFGANSVPGKIFAVDYDYGKYGIAYKDIDYQNTNSGSTWNNGWIYRNDGVDIEKCTDSQTNGYNVGWTGTGEFLFYTLNVQNSGRYSVSLRCAVNTSGGYVGMSWDGKDQALFPLQTTGGWQSWSSVPLGIIDLTEGKHTLRLNMFFGGFNINYIDLAYAGPMEIKKSESYPDQFVLEQNFPNPFNASTTIRFRLIKREQVQLKVYNVVGKEMMTVVDGVRDEGVHAVRFDADNWSSGVYYYRLIAGTSSSTKLMSLIK